MSGKGSKPRPISVDSDTYASNWDAIFSKKQMGLGRAAEAVGSNPIQAGSTPAAPANHIYVGDYQGTPIFARDPAAPEPLYQVYVDNETGA